MDRTVRIWDLRVGECIRLFSSGGGGSVTSLAFSPNGEHVVSGGDNEHLTVWSIKEGKKLKNLGWKNKNDKNCTVRSLEYSKDGTVLACATTDRCVRIWDAGLNHFSGDGARNGRDGVFNTFNTKTTDVYDLTFTERNLLVASGCSREKKVMM